MASTSLATNAAPSEGAKPDQTTTRAACCVSLRISSGPAVDAKVSTKPRRTSRTGPLRADRSSSGSRAALRKRGSASSSSRAPSAVSDTGLLPRTINLLSNSDSSLRMACETADWVMPRRVAASVMLLVVATSAKMRRDHSSIAGRSIIVLSSLQFWLSRGGEGKQPRVGLARLIRASREVSRHLLALPPSSSLIVGGHFLS